jgi:ATP-dependent protease HslVU (ClpYQ) peptidase subunit
VTAIVGIAHGGTVWLGGDSLSSAGGDLELVGDPKVFRVGPAIFGVAGSCRIYDVLRHGLEWPKPTRKIPDARDFLVRRVVPRIQQLIHDTRAGSNKDSQAMFEGMVLVGYLGKLYVLQNDFSIFSPASGYTATGSGGPHALGALEGIAQFCGGELPLTDESSRLVSVHPSRSLARHNT